MAQLMVQAQGLTRRYPEGVCALDGADLEVPEGEWLSIMGPSGSGKSTLLNLVGGLDRPTSGSLRVAGVEVTSLRGGELARFRRNIVGFIFQQFYLVPYLTAVENVMLAQYFHSMADEAEARQALEAVGLGDRLHHLPSQLSGGELQRVCLARALVNQPRLLLADEPTGNLDEQNEKVVLHLFEHIHRQGYTLLVVTHDPEVAARGSRTIHLAHGRIVGEEAGRHPLAARSP